MAERGQELGSKGVTGLGFLLSHRMIKKAQENEIRCFELSKRAKRDDYEQFRCEFLEWQQGTLFEVGRALGICEYRAMQGLAMPWESD